MTILYLIKCSLSVYYDPNGLRAMGVIRAKLGWINNVNEVLFSVVDGIEIKTQNVQAPRH